MLTDQGCRGQRCGSRGGIRTIQQERHFSIPAGKGGGIVGWNDQPRPDLTLFDQVADLIFRQSVLARPLAGPPDVPEAKVAALRKALLATMKDPEMMKDAQKIKLTFNPVPGAEVAQIFGDFLSTSPALVKRTREITNLRK